MPATTAKPLVIKFEQRFAKMAVVTSEILKDPGYRTRIQNELAQTVPGDIGSLAHNIYEVVLEVYADNFLWSTELENAIRQEVATHLSPSGSPIRTTVVRK